MSTTTRREQWQQALGLALAPAVFALHLQLNYNVVAWSCATNNRIAVPAFSFVSIVVALVGCLAARGAQRSERGGDGRITFLGALGLGISATLALILFAQLLASLFIQPCQ